MVSTTDREELSRQRKEADHRTRVLANDIRTVCDSESGLRLLWGIIEGNGLFDSIPLGGDPAVLGARIGRQEVALKLWNTMKDIGGFEMLARAHSLHAAVEAPK